MNEYTESKPRLFVATKAFVVFEGKVLILRESPKYDDGTNIGKFDVPGGRVQSGERFDQGLLREIHEETGLDVTIIRPFHTDEWRPVVKDEHWQIVGTYFLCQADNTNVILGKDHSEYQWIDPTKHQDYPLIDNLKRAFAAYVKVST